MRLRITIPAILMVMITAVLLITRLAPWKTAGHTSVSGSSAASEEQQTSANVSDSGNASPITDPSAGLRARRLNETIKAHNIPMHFYAKVIDQFDQPVREARVELHATRWFVVPPFSFDSKDERVFVTSDTNGCLDYDMGGGSTIFVKGVSLEGLELELARGKLGVSFNYSSVANGEVPTKQKPMILRVGRSLGKDLVLRRLAGYSFTSSVPVYIDLVSCKYHAEATPAADVKVVLNSLHTGGEDPFHASSAFPAHFQIEALRGELAQSSSAFLYQAPISNYSSVVSVHWPPKSTPADGGSEWFVPVYFHIRGRFYGGMIFEIPTRAEEHVPVMITRFLNPSGSALVETPSSGSDGHSSLTLTSVINPNRARILQEDPARSYEADQIDRDELSRRTASRRFLPQRVSPSTTPSPSQASWLLREVAECRGLRAVAL